MKLFRFWLKCLSQNYKVHLSVADCSWTLDFFVKDQIFHHSPNDATLCTFWSGWSPSQSANMNQFITLKSWCSQTDSSMSVLCWWHTASLCLSLKQMKHRVQCLSSFMTVGQHGAVSSVFTFPSQQDYEPDFWFHRLQRLQWGWK